MAVEALVSPGDLPVARGILPHTQNWFLPLRWYGLLIATAVLIGLNLSSRLAKLRQLENGLVSDLLPVLVLFAVIGARIYYVAFEWHNYAPTRSRPWPSGKEGSPSTVLCWREQSR